MKNNKEGSSECKNKHNEIKITTKSQKHRGENIYNMHIDQMTSAVKQLVLYQNKTTPAGALRNSRKGPFP